MTESRIGWLRCRRICLDALGCALGVGLMIALGAQIKLTPMLLPFTTSIIVVTVAPRSRAATPRSVFFGHVIAALAGLLVATLCKGSLWPASLAVGIAVIAMQLTRTLHPPAGITAFIMVATRQGWQFVLMPVAAGAVVLVAYAFLFRQIAGGWTCRRLHVAGIRKGL